MGAIQRRAQKRRRAFESAIPRLVPCKDGYTSIMVRGASMETTLAYLADLLDLPELRDPRYARSDPETEEEVDRLVLNRLLELEMDHLFHKGMGRPVERGRGEGISRRVFVSMVKTPDQVLASEQLRARGYFVEVEHPAAGRLTYPGPWFRMTETPWRVERPAPLLGQHNQEVYCGLLGYSKDDLVRLRALGVI
jgi:crotonobetainyl-CoA:carnitine CoA-transferase CaiB-like acyl-CoA transferase